jgi:hypothetical protein
MPRAGREGATDNKTGAGEGYNNNNNNNNNVLRDVTGSVLKGNGT